MKSNSRKYITTTLPYINAKGHIAHAREFVQGDVFKRIFRKMGFDVFLNIGTDEHGLKIYRKACEAKLSPEEYSKNQSQNFVDLAKALDVDYDAFIRTSEEKHIKSAQEFWKKCDENGYIYKKKYKIKYCVGCELEKTDSELINGYCPDHPNQEIEIIDEENYFFKFSAFQEKLLDFYRENPNFVKPQKRFKEIISFVNQGLEDFSISRIKEKMPWGIDVPNDSSQVMYVWFDALVNYVSTLNWPQDEDNFKKWWPAVQICGKDNLRQQSAMWQAMLLAAGFPLSKKIYVNGFISVDGQKMSKSIGNVIDPVEMIEKFSKDATRYLLVSIGSFGEDSDTSWEKLTEKYNADLANGIGNLSSRIITLYQKTEKNLLKEFKKEDVAGAFLTNALLELEEGRLENIILLIREKIAYLDGEIEKTKPWELVKEDVKKFEEELEKLTNALFEIALIIEPFMPEISVKIQKGLENKEKINLFPRI